MPDWQERSAADLGVTLVELLAYVGDHLSYRQDAVATEAYLETARLRTSLRRHALLVDYAMHDGCNARVWLHVTAGAADVSLPRAGTRFYSRVAGTPDRHRPGLGRAIATRCAPRPVVFEPLHDADAPRRAQRDRPSTPGATAAAASRPAPRARRSPATCPTSRPATSCCSRRCSAR